ncbi:MAG: SDR family oxidoreductase [Sphingomonas bacterium]
MFRRVLAALCGRAPALRHHIEENPHESLAGQGHHRHRRWQLIFRAFAAEGATVVVTDPSDRQGNMDELVRKIASKGQHASSAVLDVSSQEQWTTVVANTMNRHGQIDILINNAGTPGAARR